MKNKIFKKQTVVLILFLIIFTSFGLAEDSAPLMSQMRNAQSALNVEGFDPASQIGSTFSDSINPYTGALMFSQTDVAVPGRNGMGITLTRQYSSNIFLNINNAGSGGPECSEQPSFDGFWGDLTKTPNYVDYRSMTICYDNAQYPDSSSFIKPGILGLGMEMTKGKIKDPTGIMFGIIQQRREASRECTCDPCGIGGASCICGIWEEDPFSELVNRIYLSYNFISARGINSLSMTVNNNDQSLIVPSMYSVPDNSQLPPDAEYEFAFGHGQIRTANCEGNDCGEDGSGCGDYGVIQEYYNPIFNLWSNQIGNQNGELEGYVDPRAGVHNLLLRESLNDPESQHQDNTFTVYTEGLEPVFLSYDDLYDMALEPGQHGLKKAVYYGNDGRTYYFEHFVPFCGEYDDMSHPDYDNCAGMVTNLQPSEKRKMFTWAENVYPGLYLTKVVDTFGNTIEYTYKSSGSPFIDTISVADGQARFFYSGTGVNTRLEYIEFNSPKSGYLNPVYREYVYDETDTGMPLLTETCIVKNPSFGCDAAIIGTRFRYEYADSNELVKVYLPTGAEIAYEYGWVDEIPSHDPTRPYTEELSEQTRRVVTKRTVFYGGECPLLDGVYDGCSWNYDYEAIPKNINGHDYYDMKTTVTDPFGKKTVYYMYSSTVNPISGFT